MGLESCWAINDAENRADLIDHKPFIAIIRNYS